MNIDGVTPQISLRSGGVFDFENPQEDQIRISDIAHALSNICRFTGHTKRFYSVAEHSWHASHLVDPEYALEALLHDAAEAYIGDVSKPLKNLLPDYAKIEARVERAVMFKYGLSLPMSPEVKSADQKLLGIEQKSAMNDLSICDCLFGCSCGFSLNFWDPEQARIAFLDRFLELTGM